MEWRKFTGVSFY